MFDLQVTLDRRPRWIGDFATEVAEEVGQTLQNWLVYPRTPTNGPVRVVVFFESVPVFEQAAIENIARDHEVEAVDFNVADYSIMDPRRDEG